MGLGWALQLIAKHADALITKGFEKLMIGSGGAPLKSELALMYSLFSRVDALTALKEAFGAFIKVWPALRCAL